MKSDPSGNLVIPSAPYLQATFEALPSHVAITPYFAKTVIGGSDWPRLRREDALQGKRSFSRILRKIRTLRSWLPRA